MASSQTFHQGDKVRWASGQGTAVGTLEQYITEDQTVDGKTVSATKDNPRYLVKNDNTGKVTVHRPDTLSKADESVSNAILSTANDWTFESPEP